MSSTTGVPSFTIDYVGDKRYVIEDDNQAQEARKKEVSEEELNAELVGYGLRVVNGTLQPLDGFTLTPESQAIVTGFGGAPVLPNVTGSQEPRQNLRAPLVRVAADDDASIILMLYQVASDDLASHSTNKRAARLASKNANEMSQAAIDTDRERIGDERKAALFNLVVSTAAAAGSFAAGLAQRFGWVSDAKGAGLEASAMHIGSLINAGGAYYNKAHGWTAKAEEAGIKVKRYEQWSKEYQELAEEKQQSAKDDIEAFKRTLEQLLLPAVQAETSQVQSLTR